MGSYDDGIQELAMRVRGLLFHLLVHVMGSSPLAAWLVMQLCVLSSG